MAEVRVTPYHKSVLDWFTCTAGMDAGQFRVEAAAGHAVLGAACAELLLAAQAEEQGGGGRGDAAGRRAYAVRHAVAHLCSAGAAPAVHKKLEALLLHFEFWALVHTAGVGGSKRDSPVHALPRLATARK